MITVSHSVDWLHSAVIVLVFILYQQSQYFREHNGSLASLMLMEILGHTTLFVVTALLCSMNGNIIPLFHLSIFTVACNDMLDVEPFIVPDSLLGCAVIGLIV